MNSQPGFRDLIKNPVLAVAFGFGAGLVPKIPGTAGTIVAIPIWWALSSLGVAAYLSIIAVLACFGVWVCDRATSMLGTHDHSGIVIDEIVGYLLALLVVPAEFVWVLLSFVVFRVFDIFKPWPIGWLDRHVGGGIGVMLDDLVAGVCTGAVVLVADVWLNT